MDELVTTIAVIILVVFCWFFFDPESLKTSLDIIFN